MSHLKCLDNPVVTRLSVSAQSSTVRSRLVACHCLVHHVNDLQIRIVLLHSVKIFLNGFGLLLRRQVVHPARILRTPDQGVILEGEVMLLGIVGRTVSVAKGEAASAATFYGIPFRFVLRGYLVPEFIERIHSSTGINLIARSDISQELVRIGRQLSLYLDGTKTDHRCEQTSGNDCLLFHVFS